METSLFNLILHSNCDFWCCFYLYVRCFILIPLTILILILILYFQVSCFILIFLNICFCIFRSADQPGDSSDPLQRQLQHVSSLPHSVLLARGPRRQETLCPHSTQLLPRNTEPLRAVWQYWWVGHVALAWLVPISTGVSSSAGDRICA